MSREADDLTLQAEIERLRDVLDQIETIARNALTRPYAALRRIEELALEGLGVESNDGS